MKKHNIFLSVALAALTLVSCGKLAPSKAEVEAGFDAPISLPSLTIANPEADAAHGVVKVSVTVSGVPSDASDIVLGVMTSMDPTFATSKFVAADNVADGTFTMQGTVTPNSTYYVKAVASSIKGGSSYSEVLPVAVPKAPLWVQVPGTYVGHVVSDAYASEDYDNNVITVIPDEKDPEHYVWIAGIEPYWAVEKNYTGEELDHNYVRASIDEKNECLIVAVGADIHLGNRTIRGLDAPSMETASKYVPLVFQLKAGGNLYRANGFQTFAGDELEDIWKGDVTYVAQ